MAFDLQTVLIEKINEAHLRAYCVRFDFGECQIEALAEILMDALVDYAFGFHNGILEKYDRRILKEAATSLYKIQGYENAKKIYLDSDSVIDLNETDKTEWKSHATLTLLAKQDLPTFGYNMIAPLKSWCWGSILFYPFKISRFS